MAKAVRVRVSPSAPEYRTCALRRFFFVCFFSVWRLLCFICLWLPWFSVGSARAGGGIVCGSVSGGGGYRVRAGSEAGLRYWLSGFVLVSAGRRGLLTGQVVCVVACGVLEGG